MTTNNSLRAYVLYDSSGKIVPSSVILRRDRPKVGNWKEIISKLCCNITTTTNAILDGELLSNEEDDDILLTNEDDENLTLNE